MKILFVSPFPYTPHAGHGGATFAWAQLDVLRNHHDVFLISLEERGPFALDPGSDVASFYQKEGVGYQGVPLAVSWWSRQAARVRALFTNRPVDVESHRSRSMANAVQHALVNFKPDAVLIQFPQMAQYVTMVPGTPVLMDVVDAASVSAYRGIAAAPSFRIRFQRFVEWLRWIRYEREFYSRFNAVITLTEQDAFGLRAYNPHLNVFSLGLPHAVPDIPAVNRKRDVIRFLGNLQHHPNLDGLRYFLSEVFPRVREGAPTVIFEVAGKNPPPHLLQHAGPGVTFIGFVPDAPRFLAEASVVVIPLVSGGGLKIKTLEALGAGAAVASTAIGVEGIGGEDGVHYLVRDRPVPLAHGILSLLSNPGLATRLGTNARALIQARYSPPAWESHFTTLLDRHVQNPGEGSPEAGHVDT